MSELIRVLVIDDDAAWQKVMLLLLARRGDFDVHAVMNLQEARAQLKKNPYDIVISDLELASSGRLVENGLDVISIIEEEGLEIPVIAVTGNGNETSVVEALQRGAANYISKFNVRDHLYKTVDSVVQTIGQRKLKSKLLGSIVELKLRYCIHNDIRLISPFIEELKSNLSSRTELSTTTITRILISAEEALMNSIVHGNLEISSEIRETSMAEYHDMIETRAQDPQYQNRRVSLEISLNPVRFQLTIQDQGIGFDLSNIKDPRDEKYISRASGRGMLLMQTFMDSVEYSDHGRCICMTKMIPQNMPESDQKLNALNFCKPC
ncbi:ATP-binding response regulator [Rubinisphaera italica]|uniref:Transcriptional regulatory protein OmpR n=1 Tax=Rubinisphaera italica TaxID=2527969 RepID=A0A5C5XEW5_9PLAN|nr:response regulator [Rubinisphaera italica]TWT61199.1 Transcriptional regulatory protein OmpR [Rubinisphaera italica]